MPYISSHTFLLLLCIKRLHSNSLEKAVKETGLEWMSHGCVCNISEDSTAMRLILLSHSVYSLDLKGIIFIFSYMTLRLIEKNGFIFFLCAVASSVSDRRDCGEDENCSKWEI